MEDNMKEQFEKVKDLFGGEFVTIEDSEPVDFSKPIRGKYKARIVSLDRRFGESKAGNPYDFYSLKMQAVEDVSGDSSFNRYFDKTYSNMESEYQKDPSEGRNKLMNDLYTAQVSFDVTKDESSDPDSVIEEIAPQIKDQVVCLSCYPSSKGKQAVRIVNRFKETTEEATNNSDW